MPKTKVEVYDKDQLIYPYIESDHVTFSNGMKVSEMLDQSISMPKVVHEDSSFKVGVGDQDVSSAIVDSSVAEMTIKGKTYQNILPEPSTHVLTNNKEMFKVNEGLDPNVEIVDGVSKSAILSGQTKLMDELGNECDHPNRPNAVRGAYIDASTGEEVFVDASCRTTYIKPPHETFKIRGKNRWKKLAFYDVNKQLIKTLDPALNSYDDYIVNGTLIPSNAEYMRVSGSLNPINSGDVLEPVLEILDVNNSSLYITQLQSCKMPVLTTTGKNLFDSSTEIVTGQGINSTNGLPYNTPSHSCTGFLRVKSNTTYTITQSHNRTWVFAYNKNKEYIKVVKTDILSGGNFTTPNDTYYIRLDVNTVDTSEIVNGVQIEEGTVATSYEPYKTNILSCQLAPLNQSMFEQGTFAESTPPNTKTYQQIKLDSNNLYTTRIRTKGTYKVVKGATYEVQLNEGYGIFICYCKNGLYSATVNRWLDGTSTFTVPNDCDEMFFALRKTNNSAIAPSDYSSIGLKIHQEVVLRSLPNGVKDTLNLNTGEYVQRIKEVVFDGSSDESIGMVNVNDTTLVRFNINNVAGVQTGNTNKVLCSSLPYLYIHGLSGGSATVSQECISNHSQDANTINIIIKRSRLSSVDVAGFRAYLQSNPITIQYSIATPIVKTVDLSSSGNWEKVVLDGKPSENWQQNSHSGNFVQFEGYSNFCLYSMNLPVSNRGLLCDKLSYYGYDSKFRHTKIEGISDGGGYRLIFVRVKTEKLPTNDVAGFKQWLSQNPIEVSYMLSSNKDSTQVKQPIFFKDGHIQLSSGADHSLIPILDYQAKTSNSYVMDLMKANTRYTMKAKTASGTFTIDGTSYGTGTNGTFTTPSSITNKFLVMSNKTNEEVMIIEGDIVSKAIPYFKGIKSAFEDEDKIEVLSQGKNLFDVNEVQTDDRTRGAWETRIEGNKIYSMRVTSQVSGGEFGAFIQIPVKPSVEYVYKFDFTSTDPNLGDPQVYIYNNSSIWGEVLSSNNGKTTKFTTKANTQFITIGLNYRSGVQKGTEFCTYNAILIETTQTRDYEPYKSNNTKIPLLSPLRSLPNEVCDEIILDREKNKATLIQRVGCVMLDGSEEWSAYPTMEQDKTLLFQSKADCKQGKSARCVSDRFPYSGSLWNSGFDDEGVMMGGGGSTYKRVDLRISKIKVSSTSPTILREYLSKNPFVVLYELETPIITEVDLEGFPYIYKDGHIFLNSEIVPITEIIYSVNQCQQISASNEDIIRHEKELTYLQKLIAQYVQVDYESALLSLKV